MKKVLYLSLFLVIALTSFTACCEDDEDPGFLGADVEVTVTNALGVVQPGKTVYLYKDTPVTSSTIPGDAKKMTVTDDNGVAKFRLNLTELNILESQTTLYFAVFYTVGGETLVAGSAGVTVKRNESKKIGVEIPL